ncbi:hypothetical protein [Kineococcus sp. R86509]
MFKPGSRRSLLLVPRRRTLLGLRLSRLSGCALALRVSTPPATAKG